ncbi:MAG: type 1 glutamine amidotransferase [Saprospiraceae bacterium]
METARLAILDMYEGLPNQGMRCIKEILSQFGDEVEWEIFDVRSLAEVPDLSFDIYISTGGPGNPTDGDGVWDVKYYKWLDAVWQWNQNPENSRKHVFLICHSFQMACLHFGLAEVSRRKSISFGTFICHITEEGHDEPLFNGLENPFYVADFRDFQVTQPDEARFDDMGAKIVALEKLRPHIALERALMAVRFSEEIFGVQFHPEADSEGMLKHFLEPERRHKIVLEHSEEKYLQMIEHLNDPGKIGLTHDIILPLFLRRALSTLSGKLAVKQIAAGSGTW